MAQTARVKVLPPAEEIDPDADPYVPREPTGAPLSGYSLAAYTAAYEGPLGRALYERAAAANGLHRVSTAARWRAGRAMQMAEAHRNVWHAPQRVPGGSLRLSADAGTADVVMRSLACGFGACAAP